MLLQGYPNLEYIIIDGGSTDGSVDIIRRYEPWLAYWVSEPDRGQSHAINKGFEHSTGEIMAYLNSDDIYYPGAIHTAVKYLLETGFDILVGAVDLVELKNSEISVTKQVSPNHGASIHIFPIFTNGRNEYFMFLQPSMFWRREMWHKTGAMNENYTYIMDREWCTRAISKNASVYTIDQVLARFMLHPGSKTHDEASQFLIERASMYLDFSRKDDFRTIPCWLEWFYTKVQIWQNRIYNKSDELFLRGSIIKSWSLRILGASIRRVRLGLDFIGKLQKS